jgi:hypothetical protein
MDELVSMVSEKAGITPDQAKIAVQVVAGYLKDKLPPPIASQVEGYLSGGSGGEAPQNPLGKLFG